MVNAEFSFARLSESDGFYASVGFEKTEVIKIEDDFNQRLIKGFDGVISNEGSQDLLTLLPSLSLDEIDTKTGMIDSQAGNIIVVALSKLKGFEIVIDLIASGYLDIERLEHEARTINEDKVSIKEKRISCTKTVLPLISRGERFRLTKEVYTLHDQSSEASISREIQIDYSLSRSDVTLPPKNS